MRLQLIILLFLFSIPSFAESDKEVRELFKKYDLIMKGHKTELIDEVFTKKFLKEVEGREAFIKRIKTLPKSPEKSIPTPDVEWKKGLKDEIYFAKFKENKKDKSKADASHTEFVLVKENGKLKINDTLSDAE